MKKLFVIMAIVMMFAATGCTCSRQTEKNVEEEVIETVDIAAVETVDSAAVEVADSTLTVE